jgi:hypothetical protein
MCPVGVETSHGIGISLKTKVLPFEKYQTFLNQRISLALISPFDIK